jgi:N6-L-threonylcarbamoyladenine synthase
MIAAAGSAMFIDGIRGNLAMNGKPGMPLVSWND